jgi:hypothetical protein
MAIKIVSGRGNTPPYVPYPSFKTLMIELHEHGVPSRIDRSVLKRFSGIIGSQLLTTLRFLKLIDEQSHPTPRLTELVKVSGTPEWGAQMIAVLQDAYAPLFGLDLGNATASHFDETFRKSFPSADSVSQKSIAFFLGAAKDSGITISDRVLAGRKTRQANGVGGKQRIIKGISKKKETAPADEGQTNTQKPTTPGDPSGQSAFERELLAKFPSFDPTWPDDIKSKWFEGFQQFMAHAKRSEGA